MLSNRMQLTSKAEEQLRRLKTLTGVTPNVLSRIAFFLSIENSYLYEKDSANITLNGSLVLDKNTWLGDTAQATELLLKMLYPDLNNREIIKAWASHVEDGIANLRNHKSLASFCLAI
ncbi:DNA sulfur modification protein DndE [Cronobacter dublinensis]|uniref:DNA sulfur modification protein DndE n=1 Tax=Cronobacter dublinensis TaxID=413497 RepID=UPI0024AE6844|nr:DNA sulfur modification protein DndE [Cronobacter dublinensis]EGT4359819.1 DNA sulfur modification protein DndE [Cronobacter dublinensis]ELQ6169873.1 DNA sulfur modification protein DndE [Cronobacter dublinensis]MDI6476911.1 DNA sulfur modification protein DndE [Cronobacter dublinensis]